MLIRFQKDFLRDILSLRLVANEANRGGEDHILIIAHKRGEVDRGDHSLWVGSHWSFIVHAENTARFTKSQKIDGMKICPRQAHRQRCGPFTLLA